MGNSYGDDEDDDTDKDNSKHIPPLAAFKKGKGKAEKLDACDLEELSSYEVIEPEEFTAVCNTSKAFELAEISLSYGMEAAEFLEGDSRGFMVIASVGYHSSQGFRSPVIAPTLGSRLLSLFTKRNSGATATPRNVTRTPPQHQPAETIASQAAIDVPDSKRSAIIKQSTRIPLPTHTPRGFWSRLFKRSSRPSSVSDRS
ncbi:uncharacterized protein LAESUDRAFT_722176 [Laetiporus sulphureus 93-53]|uniref:Uncharacterized protein n=1 Tax=Laetiporus sulphureus 93-53 TaxID=1314785 RepID=A0A165G9N1_9APHY|nr:uncharacterized protein LAESUDRAFT_722176 [Laetiporus sulphureus 93-53]KZT10032.1 hypothetical protein LAESUDRAFT_722176 [Laetiporus sulphureus 93-53]